MKKFSKWREIKQFRNIIYDIRKNVTFKGFDENDNPIYDNTIKLPSVSVTGTEKIHGCLKYDTLITTKEYGDIPIREIVENKLSCHVLTMNLETNENEWNIVKNHWGNESDKTWFKITLEDGSEIIATGNHKIFNPESQKYIPVNELKKDDILLKR